MSGKNDKDGVLDHPNGAAHYSLDPSCLNLEDASVQIQEYKGNPYWEWRDVGNSSWVHYESTPTQFYNGDGLKTLPNGLFVSHDFNLVSDDFRVVVRFPDAAFGYDGKMHDVVMTLDQIDAKPASGYTDDICILSTNVNTNFYSVQMNRTKDLSCGAKFRVNFSIPDATPSQKLFLVFKDLDMPGMGGNYADDSNYTESILVYDIFPGTQPTIPRNNTLRQTISSTGIVYSGKQVLDNGQLEAYRGAVSWFASATDASFYWCGSRCWTDIGDTLNNLDPFEITVKIKAEAYDSPVSGGTRKYDTWTEVSKTVPSLMPTSFEWEYTLFQLVWHTCLDFYGGGDWDSTPGWTHPTWDYPADGKTVSTNDSVHEDTELVITVNRNRYTYTFNKNLPSGASASNLSNMPYPSNSNKKTVVCSTHTLGKSDVTVASPTLTGYTFKGWNTKADGTGDAYEGGVQIQSNKTFYAQWEKADYTVYFNANGSTNPNHETGEKTQNTTEGTMSAQTINCGVATTLKQNAFTREGYAFMGWNTKSDGTGTSYFDKQSVTDIASAGGSITLYAKWAKQVGCETLTVTDSITDAKVEGVKLKLQKKVNGVWTDIESKTTNRYGQINVNDLHWFDYRWVMEEVPTGYELASSNTTFSINYDDLSATNAIVLRRISYKVKYNANGSSNPSHQTGEYKQNITTGTMPNSEYTYGVAGTLRKNAFKREGYTFNGWNTKPDGSGTAYANEYDNVYNWSSESGDTITLYAQWAKKLGTETFTVISEETGNPVKGVKLKLQKNVSGSWQDGTTATTGTNGQIEVSNLHWFDYRWVMTDVPAGYQTGSNVSFTIKHNKLSAQDEVILYMKHVSIKLNSRVSDVIKGENAPAFIYHVKGTDAAGVRHEYSVLVQTDAGTKRGSDALSGIFAGTYEVTQAPVSRYVPGRAENISNATINSINATVDVLNHDSAEATFPYTIREYGWLSGTDSLKNHLSR